MSSTQFVEMYHPLIPSTEVTPARVPVQAIDENAARGWLLVDPDGVLPTPSTPYYTKEALLSQIQGGAAPIGTALRAAFGSPTYLEGTPLFVYGSSYTTDPGEKCTPGMEFFKLVKDRLRMSAVTTYGASGKSIRDAAQRIIGGKGVTGAAWTPGRKGVAVIDTWVNDVAAYAPGPVARAFVAKDVTGIKNNLRAALAAIIAASRVEETVATFTGTWSTDSTTDYSGGGTRYTTEVGARVDIPVTVPAAGYVYYHTFALDPAVFVPANITVLLDGQPLTTITGSTLEAHQSVEGGTSPTSPAAVKITAAAGAHTLSIVHAGTTGQFVFFDAVSIPADSPPPIFVVQDPLPIVGNYNQASVDIMAANKPQLDAAYATVIAEFPNAVFVPTTLTAATDLAVSDRLHPNDRGMVRKADELASAIRSSVRASRPDALYATL